MSAFNLNEKFPQFRNSMLAKLIMIALVLLLCQIPVGMVSDLIRRRANLAENVEAEVAAKWGYRQQITGPLLAIPVSRNVTQVDPKGVKTTRKEYSVRYSIPANLEIKGELFPEIRYRGIYEVILYRSNITLQGIFDDDIPLSPEWQRDGKPYLVVGVADVKGLSGITAKVLSQTVKIAPGTGHFSPFSQGFFIPLETAEKIPFHISFELNGCRDLLFTMLGRDTRLHLASAWSSPSFSGSFLPQKREVSEQGFSAQWNVSEFNRNLPVSWLGRAVSFSTDTMAGVSLLKQANSYAQVTRSVEYSILVFLIVLMAMLIAEKANQIWVHPLQYFIAGLSLVLFYSITLALSEHMNFAAAYWIGAAAITGLTSFYGALIYRRAGAVAGLAGAFLAAYATIYVILQLEDYALIAGSAALFILLAVLMVFTGKINRNEFDK